MSIKQREFYRVPLESPAEVKTDKGDSIAGRCVNISMGGMCLALNGALPQQSPGTVRMKYDQGGGSVEFCAQFSVAWTSTERRDVPLKQAGIQFKDLDEENRTRLALIIQTRLAEIEKDGH